MEERLLTPIQHFIKTELKEFKVDSIHPHWHTQNLFTARSLLTDTQILAIRTGGSQKLWEDGG